MAWTQSGNIRGASGVPGASGSPGASGTPGASGASGLQGASGVPGATGPTGASGASGGTGGVGASGPGFYRTIATLTEPTTVGASGSTDYVYLLSSSVTSTTVTYAPNSNDKLLLLGDAANNSTTFTDSATTPKTMTRNGSPVISTTQSKYGGSSMYFPNSQNNGTNYLTTTSSDFAFGTGDFTAECWIYPTLFSDYNAVCGTRNTSGNDANGWSILIASGGEIAVYSNNFYATSAAGTITLNSWQHVAVCRSGSTTRTFKNGVQVGTTTSFTANLTNTLLSVGSYSGDATQPFTGYVDELRIANVAKYTSSTSFTPPQFSSYTGNVTIYGTPTLPAAATANTNKSLYMFRNRSGASIIVGASGSQQINGATGGLSLSNNSFVQLVSDGTGWYTIG